MNELLQAIKATAQANLDIFRRGDISIVAHEDLLPTTSRNYALCLKDGVISRMEEAGGMWEVTLNVKIILWVGLLRDDASLIGMGSDPGILDLAQDIHAVFDDNLFGLPDYISAFSPSEGESQPYGGNGRTMQRKIINYQYIKEEERP